MAFVVVLFRGEEVDRRELNGPMVIGRSPEVDISVRDILLSRRHCKIAPAAHNTWTVEDLGSKNGTRINGELVQYSVLSDGTSIRIGGKTQVKFYVGSLANAPAPRKPASSPSSGGTKRRPADPFEALSGTVAGFEYKFDGPARDLSKLPTPAPQPADPRGYVNEDVYTMLTEIASSSWDSIYATASGPAAVVVAGQKKSRPKAGVTVAGNDLPPRCRNVVPDTSLQVDHDESATKLDHLANAPTHDATQTIPESPNQKTWFGGLMRQVKHVLTGRFLRRAI